MQIKREDIKTESKEEEKPDVPGKCKSLILKENAEFAAALEALDSKGQRIVGNMLAGAETAGVAERLTNGDVAVLSEHVITGKRRSDNLSDRDGQGRTMRAALKIAGITETYLANVLKAGMKASKISKAIDNKGKSKREPDHAVRLRYLELAHRLRGDLSQDKQAGQETIEERIRTIMARRPDALKE